MARKRHLLFLEHLEQRQLLSASPWFENSGQVLGANHDAIELGDLDGDGDLDALVGCRNHRDVPTCSQSEVWLNDGSGQFAIGWSGGATYVNEVALGDLDGDGDLDVFVTRVSPFSENARSEVWLNNGRGHFEDSGQLLNDFSRDVVLGDVDGDGDLDAVTASIARPSNVWLNDGSGMFRDSGQRLASDGWSFSVAMGDVDGDGDLDAWFGRGTDGPSNTDLLYLNDGHGNFTDSGQRLNTVSTGDVQLADLDGDGDLDAYLTNGYQTGGRGTDRVWLNDGTGRFTDSGQRLGRLTGRSVELGDLNGDGYVDAIVANGGTLGVVIRQPNEIWLNDGSGVFRLAQELGNEASAAAALGDVDNDGDLDVLFANIGDNNQVWLNEQLYPGDANRDGRFDSADLVLVFQAGQYEDDLEDNSTWEEGDWNGDRDFDSGDLVAAFQDGRYESRSSTAAHAVSASVDWLFAEEDSIRRSHTVRNTTRIEANLLDV